MYIQIVRIRKLYMYIPCISSSKNGNKMSGRDKSAPTTNVYSKDAGMLLLIIKHLTPERRVISATATVARVASLAPGAIGFERKSYQHDQRVYNKHAHILMCISVRHSLSRLR